MHTGFFKGLTLVNTWSRARSV